MRTAVCSIVFCAVALYAGTEPKAKPPDYPASSPIPSGGWIAADFGGHTFSAENTSLFVEDYLCIEVAIFPEAGGKEIPVSAAQFGLRLNHRKPLLAQTPGMVAASLKYTDWGQRPTTIGQVGPVVIGPTPQSRFPGDPSDRRTRVPPTVSSDPAAEAERPPKVTAAEAVVHVALEEGPTRSVRSGYLYFPYRGKLDKLHSIELVYSGGEAPVSVKLR